MHTNDNKKEQKNMTINNQELTKISMILYEILVSHIIEYDKTLFGNIWHNYDGSAEVKFELIDNLSYDKIGLNNALYMIKYSIEQYLKTKNFDNYVKVNISDYSIKIKLKNNLTEIEFNEFLTLIKLMGLA